MTERPILFNAWSVPRILAEAKTQTRRVIKPQPRSLINGWPTVPDKRRKPMRVRIPSMTAGGGGVGFGSSAAEVYPSKLARCPYGIPGDRLWVRETWATPGNFDHLKPSDLAASHFSSDMLIYRATEQYGDVYYRWRPSIFMPRWASRITLENREVRVERVQDISDEDVGAEGIYNSSGLHLWHCPYTVFHPDQPCKCGERTPQEEFADLWDFINAKPRRSRRNPYTGEPEDCYVGYPWEDMHTERKLPSGRVEYIMGNPRVWAVLFSLLEVRR